MAKSKRKAKRVPKKSVADSMALSCGKGCGYSSGSLNVQLVPPIASPSLFNPLDLYKGPPLSFFNSPQTWCPDLSLEMRERNMGHYSSFHQILLVGEGDFSFSLSLAKAFGHASNMIATSLDSPANLEEKYQLAMDNVRQLRALGCRVGHGVDVNSMASNFLLCLCYLKFDRIIFNFPHAGFEYPEEDTRQIKLHRKLLKGFFENAKKMLRKGGEIHVTHKTAAPFSNWNLLKKAEKKGLILVEEAPFRVWHYPGYRNKRGYGVVSDTSFPLGKSSTFKFIAALYENPEPSNS